MDNVKEFVVFGCIIKLYIKVDDDQVLGKN